MQKGGHFDIFECPWRILSVEGNPFPAKNQTLEMLQSKYIAYEAGIISSYLNRIIDFF